MVCVLVIVGVEVLVCVGVLVCVDVGGGVAPMDRVGVGVEGNDSVKVKVSV